MSRILSQVSKLGMLSGIASLISRCASVAADKSFQQQNSRFYLIELLEKHYSNKILGFVLMKLLINDFCKCFADSLNLAELLNTGLLYFAQSTKVRKEIASALVPYSANVR